MKISSAFLAVRGPCLEKKEDKILEVSKGKFVHVETGRNRIGIKKGFEKKERVLVR